VKALSGKEVCKLLEQHGWILRRITGSHHIYTKHGRSMWLSVPVHHSKSLKRGILRDILKNADLLDKI